MLTVCPPYSSLGYRRTTRSTFKSSPTTSLLHHGWTEALLRCKYFGVSLHRSARSFPAISVLGTSTTASAGAHGSISFTSPLPSPLIGLELQLYWPSSSSALFVAHAQCYENCLLAASTAASNSVIVDANVHLLQLLLR